MPMGQLTVLQEAESNLFGEDRSSEFQKLRDQLDNAQAEGATPQGAPARRSGDGDAAANVTANVTSRTPRQKQAATKARRSTNQMTDQNQANQQPHGSNVASLDQYIEKAKELGKMAAQGKNVGVTFLLECFEGGYLGGLSTENKPDGTEGDHAVLASAYSTANGLTNMFDAKAGNQRKLKSDIKTAIRVGGNPKWGHGQPIGTTNQLMTKWRALKAKKVEGLMDAYNMLLRFWRAASRMDVLPDEGELDDYCYKPGAKSVSGERVIEQIRKLASKLAQGKVSNCSDHDDSAEIKTIINAATKRLAQIAKDRGADEKKGRGRGKAQPQGATTASAAA